MGQYKILSGRCLHGFCTVLIGQYNKFKCIFASTNSKKLVHIILKNSLFFVIFLRIL